MTGWFVPTNNAQPQAAPKAHGGFLHGLEQLGSNFVHGAEQSITGLPVGLLNLATHPVRTADAIGHAYADKYGGLFTGHAGQSLHKMAADPFGTALDVASVAAAPFTLGGSLGVGAAEATAGVARAGALASLMRPVVTAGRLAARSDAATNALTKLAGLERVAGTVPLAERTTGTIYGAKDTSFVPKTFKLAAKDASGKGLSGNVDLSKNALIRQRQIATNKALAKLPDNTPLVGNTRRIVRLDAKNLGAQGERVSGAFIPAFHKLVGKLSSPHQTVLRAALGFGTLDPAHLSADVGKLVEATQAQAGKVRLSDAEAQATRAVLSAAQNKQVVRAAKETIRAPKMVERTLTADEAAAAAKSAERQAKSLLHGKWVKLKNDFNPGHGRGRGRGNSKGSGAAEAEKNLAHYMRAFAENHPVVEEPLGYSMKNSSGVHVSQAELGQIFGARGVSREVAQKVVSLRDEAARFAEAAKGQRAPGDIFAGIDDAAPITVSEPAGPARASVHAEMVKKIDQRLRKPGGTDQGRAHLIAVKHLLTDGRHVLADDAARQKLIDDARVKLAEHRNADQIAAGADVRVTQLTHPKVVEALAKPELPKRVQLAYHLAKKIDAQVSKQLTDNGMYTAAELDARRNAELAHIHGDNIPAGREPVYVSHVIDNGPGFPGRPGLNATEPASPRQLRKNEGFAFRNSLAPYTPSTVATTAASTLHYTNGIDRFVHLANRATRIPAETYDATKHVIVNENPQLRKTAGQLFNFLKAAKPHLEGDEHYNEIVGLLKDHFLNKNPKSSGMVSVVPKAYADQLVGEVAKAGKAYKAFVQAPTRFYKSLVFGRGLYITGNLFGALMQGLVGHGPGFFRDLAATLASKKLRGVVAEGLPDVLGGGLGTELKKEIGYGKKSKIGAGIGAGADAYKWTMSRAPHFNQKLVDNPTRTAAVVSVMREPIRRYISEQAAQGNKVSMVDAARELLAQPKFANDVARRVNNTMIDFKAHGRGDKVLSDTLLFAMWLKGIAGVTGRVLKDQPGVFNAGAQISREGLRQNQRDLGQLPSYLAGAIPLSRHGDRARILTSQQLNPFATSVDLLDQGKQLITGNGTQKASPLAQLNPVWRSLIEAGTGKDQFTGGPVTPHGGMLPTAVIQFLKNTPDYRLLRPYQSKQPLYSDRHPWLNFAGAPLKDVNLSVAAQRALAEKQPQKKPFRNF